MLVYTYQARAQTFWGEGSQIKKKRAPIVKIIHEIKNTDDKIKNTVGYLPCPSSFGVSLFLVFYSV